MSNNNSLRTSNLVRKNFLAKMAQATLSRTKSITDSESRLGQLLLRTGQLTDNTLNSSLQIAESVRLPLGVVLSMNKIVEQPLIDCAIQVQQLIHRGMAPSIARMILRYASAAGVTAQQAVEDFSFDSESSALECWVRNILIECEILTGTELDELKRDAKVANQPWVRFAAENGLISIHVLSSAMHAIVLMDLGRMSHGDAVALIKAAKSNPKSTAVLLRMRAPEHKIENCSMHVTALLFASGLITERTALDLLSLAYRLNQDVSDLLEDYQLVTNNQIQTALDMCRFMNRGLSQSSAIGNLKAGDQELTMTADKMVCARWHTICA